MLHRIRARVRRTFHLDVRRADVRERDIAAELELCVEERVAYLMARGMSAAEARAEAVRRVGPSVEGARRELQRSAARRDLVLAAREQLDALVRDVRYALRGIGRRKAFAAVVLATLALGIAGTTVIYSVVYGVLIRPLPFPDAGGLISVWVPRGGGERGDMSPPDMGDVLAQSPSVTALVGFAPGTATLSGVGEPTVVAATRVSGDMLATFGVRPAVGRDITSGEAGFGAPRIAVVSYAFWRDRLGSPGTLDGRTITLGRATFEVVGVAPVGFDFPARTDVWVPHAFSSPQGLGRASHTWLTVGRLAPGAGVPAAQLEATMVADRLARSYPETNGAKAFRVERLQDRIVGDVRSRLWLLMGAAAAVLLIACANAATLLLIRGHERAGEVAVRTALGASRASITRQSLVETAVYASVGGALGVALAYAGVGLFRSAGGELVPRLSEVALSGPVLWAVTGMVAAVTALAGLLPALYLARAPIAENLVKAGRSDDAGRSGRRVRNLLIGAEVALAFVLLNGSGLLVRSLAAMHATPLGFESRGILRFSLSQGGPLERMRTFYRTMEHELGAIPGVLAVGSVFGAPLAGGPRTTAEVRVEGQPEPAPEAVHLAGIRAASPDYLQTMGIPLVAGRTLERSDDDAALPVAVVNGEFVRQNFPGENPLGRRVRILTDQGYGSPTWTIVGVVGDIRSERVTELPLAEIYVPHGQFGPGYLTIHVRSDRDPRDLLAAVRAEVRRVAPAHALIRVETVAEAVDRETASLRFLTLVGGLFAVISAALAAIGLYGALSFIVAQRTREIGVRLAVGAQPRGVARLIVSEGALVTAGGAVAGIVGSLWSGRFLGGVLFGITPSDPGAAVLAAAALLAAVSGAMLLPALRAARVDPMAALRTN